jgi:hypothetical protein
MSVGRSGNGCAVARQMGGSTSCIFCCQPIRRLFRYPWQANFSVVADAAGFYGRGAQLASVTGTGGGTVAMTTTAANSPQVSGGATATTVTTVFDMALLGTGMGHGMGLGNRNITLPTNGQIFVSHGGMIIDSLGTLSGETTVATAMHGGGGAANAVNVTNLPGNVAGAFYGIYALGWGNGVLAAGSTHVNLNNGTATAHIKMR